tara:strand:+ start:5822 stop:6010 length:189 start_codon:yes stop_codon:yes gene_type:complete
MENTKKQLIEWLKENKKILHIRNIEKRIGIPDSTIGKALLGTRNLPDKWVEPLEKFRTTFNT